MRYETEQRMADFTCIPLTIHASNGGREWGWKVIFPSHFPFPKKVREKKKFWRKRNLHYSSDFLEPPFRRRQVFVSSFQSQKCHHCALILNLYPNYMKQITCSLSYDMRWISSQGHLQHIRRQCVAHLLARDVCNSDQRKSWKREKRYESSINYPSKDCVNTFHERVMWIQVVLHGLNHHRNNFMFLLWIIRE